MLEQLFGSKTRAKLLKVFFMKPDQEFFVRELSRMIDVQINAIRRELELLIKIGLIKEIDGKQSKRKGKDTAETGESLRKYYRLHIDSIIYPELHALMLKEKLTGEEVFVKELEKKIGEVKLLLLTGSFTGERRVASDLLLVGDIKEGTLVRLIQTYEKEFGFPIRYTVMTEKEFIDRRYVMDKFLYSLFEGYHLKVVNTLGV